MSNMQTCLCDRKFYRVEHRHHNHSYFEKPQGGAHYSNYSGIRCIKCGWRFRSKAKWVDRCEDLTQEEYDSIPGGQPNVGYSVSIQSWRV